MSKSAIAAIDTREVSLVKAGAVRRRFAITKAEKGSVQMDPKVIQQIMATPAKGEDAVTESLKAEGKTDEQIAAAIAQFRLVSGTRDLVGDDDFVSVAKAAGIELPASKTETETKKNDDPPKPVDDPKVEEALKSATSKIDELTAKLEEVTKSAQTATEQMAELKDEKFLREAIEKAEEYKAIGDPAEIGAFLKALSDHAPDHRASAEKILAAAAERVSKSSLFRDIGGSGSGGDVILMDAEQELERLAEERVIKAREAGREKVTKAIAYAEVMKENPKLVQRHKAEKRERLSRAPGAVGGV